MGTNHGPRVLEGHPVYHFIVIFKIIIYNKNQRPANFIILSVVLGGNHMALLWRLFWFVPPFPSLFEISIELHPLNPWGKDT